MAKLVSTNDPDYGYAQLVDPLVVTLEVVTGTSIALAVPTLNTDGGDITSWKRLAARDNGAPISIWLAISATNVLTVESAFLYGYDPSTDPNDPNAPAWFQLGALNDGEDIELSGTSFWGTRVVFAGIFSRLAVAAATVTVTSSPPASTTITVTGKPIQAIGG